MKQWKLLAVIFAAALVGTVTLSRFLPASIDRLEPEKTVIEQPKSEEGEAVSSQSHTQQSVLHVSESDFAQEVLHSKVPVLVDFYADWCGPCRMLAPVIEEVAREMSGVKIVKVNVDHAPALADRYGISGIPALLVFNNGEVTAQEMGLASKSEVKAMLRR
jgi:thioredoxin 1